jgi:branched-chain amino acid transport system permease protein
VNRPFVRTGLTAGAIGGIVIVYFAAVGMVERLETLSIVGSKLRLTWLLVVGPPALAAYASLRPKIQSGERVEPSLASAVMVGIAAGGAAGVIVAAGIGIVNWLGVDSVRAVFRSISPTLVSILTFHASTEAGSAVLFALIVVAGVVGAALRVMPRSFRQASLNAAGAVIVLGLLQRIVPTALDQLHIERDWLYSRVTLGLSDLGAVLVFAVAFGATFALRGRSLRDFLRPPPRSAEAEREREKHPTEGRRASRRTIVLIVWGVLAAILVFLPPLVGPVVSNILGKVGIFLLLGLGLNIVVGYAGLLDLGYVAFFSVGAYTMAILSGGQRLTFKGYQPPAFGANLSFYEALPIVVVIAALIGVMIGAPVLRLRGDYLAIVTLGFGEIARVIFGSTWAQNLFGGANGMGLITKAPIGSFEFHDPEHFYYLVLAFCALAIYVSWRLQDSRIGRAWNAMREDEQVADVMGISTIRYKLLAFAMGGAIGSIGGALFGVYIGSLTIVSFQIIVSITALAIIILGGLGSIPGAVVGALVLIGLPGVLSEFEEYQLLIYGAVLIAIMLLRPQGLVPSVRRSRELHEEDQMQDEWAETLAEREEVPAVPLEGSAS